MCWPSIDSESSLEPFSTVAVYHVTSDEADPCSLMDSSGNIRRHRVFSEEEDARPARVDASWRLAMRVLHDAEGPQARRTLLKKGHSDTDRQTQSQAQTQTQTGVVPPVVVALPSKCAYFLLDEYRHHHQHSGKCTA